MTPDAPRTAYTLVGLTLLTVGAYLGVLTLSAALERPPQTDLLAVTGVLAAAFLAAGVMALRTAGRTQTREPTGTRRPLLNPPVTLALLLLPVLLHLTVSRTLEVTPDLLWAGVTVHAIWNTLLLRTAHTEAERHPGRWTLPRVLTLALLPAAFPVLLLLL